MGSYIGLLILAAIALLMITANAALPYLFGPLLIHRTFLFRCPARIVYFDADSLSLPADVSSFLLPACGTLTELGFRSIAHFCLPDVVPNAKSINVLLVNEATAEAAMVEEVPLTRRQRRMMRRQQHQGEPFLPWLR